MNSTVENTGTILDADAKNEGRQAPVITKWLKDLVFGTLDIIFKRSCQKPKRNHSYYCTSKHLIVENNLIISDKVQMADILVENAELSAYIIVLDEKTSAMIEQTVKKQEDVLKLKEVSEERLRMVVQL